VTAAPFTVRTATRSEWERVGELALRAYEDSQILGSDDSYRDVLRDVASRAVAPGVVLVAAEPDGTVIGTVTCCPGGADFADIAVDGEAEFRMLAVEPAARGRGVARALIDACRDLAVGWGAQRLVLSVIDHNAPAAALYASIGFVRVPERDWTPVPDVLLEVWTRDVP
jgi:ribosomal protein S18 acetylase RimI-like enzyme